MNITDFTDAIADLPWHGSERVVLNNDVLGSYYDIDAIRYDSATDRLVIFVGEEAPE